MSYAECLKKYDNAVDGTFYDAIKIQATASERVFCLYRWVKT